MHLDHPLSTLVDKCQTICVPECCGLDAYDFSPIHIASFLILWRGDVDEAELSKLREQIQSLRNDYGLEGKVACGVQIEQLNQSLLGAEVDRLADTLLRNIDAAIEIIAQCRPSKLR